MITGGRKRKKTPCLSRYTGLKTRRLTRCPLALETLESARFWVSDWNSGAVLVLFDAAIGVCDRFPGKECVGNHCPERRMAMGSFFVGKVPNVAWPSSTADRIPHGPRSGTVKNFQYCVRLEREPGRSVPSFAVCTPIHFPRGMQMIPTRMKA